MINFQYDQDVEYQAIREEERAEGERKKAIEMAKKSLSAGLDLELIVELTGLPLELIETLSSD